MMLSELVAYRRHLQEITHDGSVEYLRQEIDPVIYTVSNAKNPNSDHIMALEKAKNKILAGLQDFQQTLECIQQDLIIEIEKIQPTYLARSYGLYQDMCRGDSPEYILGRRIPITAQTKDFVLSRIRRRDSWQYPALILRPGLEEWIDHMVAFDPLYVADHHIDLLVPAQSRFNAVYNSRVRWIPIAEKDDQEMLVSIPNDQIGFVIAWNFFHYKPFEVIKQYITEVYQKLRPGGVFAFSINDGDLPGGVANAERMWMCYTPGSMIMSISEHIGFEVILRHELDRAVSWIELQKPGDRLSLRAGQALAKIIPKNLPKVDNTKNKIYTQQEIENIIQQAIDLNIDTPHQLRHAYNPQKLETIIRKRKSK